MNCATLSDLQNLQLPSTERTKPHRPPGMQSRRDAAAPAELLPTTSSFDRLLELAVDLRDSQQNKARQTQHRRRRATVTLHLGLLVRVLNHHGS